MQSGLVEPLLGTYLQNELEASFKFEDTPDQLTTTQAVKLDMEKPHPMDRLVCGDVGFGKTEIAVRKCLYEDQNSSLGNVDTNTKKWEMFIRIPN